MEQEDLTRLELGMGVLQKRLPRALINLTLIPWLLTYGTVDPTTGSCPPEKIHIESSDQETDEYDTSLRVSTLNMEHGKGGTRSIGRAILQQDVDVIGLQEATETSAKDILSYLEDNGAYYHAAAGWNKTAYGGSYGNVILSRHPILRSINYRLRQPEEFEARGLLVSQIMLGGLGDLPLTVGTTHLTPNEPGVFGKSNYSVRTVQATEIGNIMKLHASAGGDVVLMGDLNTSPKNDAHKTLNKSFKDATAGSRERPVTHPFSKSQIDYIFYGVGLDVKEFKTWGANSDHCGITVSLTPTEHITTKSAVK